MRRHADPSAVATVGTRAGSPVLEAYQAHSAIPAGCPPTRQIAICSRSVEVVWELFDTPTYSISTNRHDFVLGTFEYIETDREMCRKCITKCVPYSTTLHV